MVMPGFRFHPTEEELIEFYLRRKVEGKRFNVELITFLDLYRYDPWELPALAAIGEKEWFFYVPRDRKYRNGDRPNRVTTTGYWKATGADRMIRTESSKSIGLKKTLVFYSGKAPKGIRTSWIMNEYRLPQHETDRYQKAEISLCRVYKRAGVDDSTISPGPSSRGIIPQPDKKQGNIVHRSPASLQHPPPLPTVLENPHEAEGGSSNTTDNWTALGLANPRTNYCAIAPITSTVVLPPASTPQEDETLLHHSKQVGCSLFPPNNNTLFTCSSSMPAVPTVDELHRIVHYQQAYTHQQQQQQQHDHHQNATQFLQLPSQPQQPELNPISNSLPTFQDRLWEWNLIPEANRDYNSSSSSINNFK
ncbi:NAC domain [Macleaya cordata]|uniref:NAC domain n=1 Tax=Macleaya cordata TaxID=56857 RepID=A0A200PZR6_MACCD|nr:NAC domain [Macleaya cordata]